MTAAEGMASEIFRHRVLGGSAFKGSIRAHDTWAETLTSMESEDGGIGVVSWPPEGESDLKTLLVAPTGDEVAFGPTAENLVAGDYPLALSLSLAFERTRAEALMPWLKFWYGEEISAALRESHLMPLPRTARNQQVFDLEVMNPRG